MTISSLIITLLIVIKKAVQMVNAGYLQDEKNKKVSIALNKALKVGEKSGMIDSFNLKKHLKKLKDFQKRNGVR